MKTLCLTFCIALAVSFLHAAERTPPAGAKPVPDHQVLPLPSQELSFTFRGRELTRYYFAPGLMRPFWYPLAGPEGRSLTRMGHPHDPVGHSHHYSVWIAHNDVGGVNFWADPNGGRIVHQRIELLDDTPQAAVMITSNAWLEPTKGKLLMSDRRRAEVRWLGADQWLLLVDLQLEAPKGSPVTLGQTPFGPFSVRMAKTIGVTDGGGRILNSEGQVNEKGVFRKPARWVDYSGPVTNEIQGGVTLMDHPSNLSHPTPFHVRDDGWMGASLTFLKGPITVVPGKPLRLRYGLWVHRSVPAADEVERHWKVFAQSPPADLFPSKR
jgi:hypothetical protein